MEPVAYRSICIVPAAPVGLYLTVDLSSHWSASFVGIVVPGEVLVLSHQMGGSDHDLRPSWFPERDRCRARKLILGKCLLHAPTARPRTTMQTLKNICRNDDVATDLIDESGAEPNRDQSGCGWEQCYQAWAPRG
jgi:hypothetical protein